MFREDIEALRNRIEHDRKRALAYRPMVDITPTLPDSEPDELQEVMTIADAHATNWDAPITQRDRDIDAAVRVLEADPEHSERWLLGLIAERENGPIDLAERRARKPRIVRPDPNPRLAYVKPKYRGLAH